MNWWRKIYETTIAMQSDATAKYRIALHIASLYHFPTSVKRDTLHPDLRKKYDQLEKVMKDHGMEIYIASGIRSGREQQELYEQGRSKPGNIVTNAKPFQSYHNYGLAVDVIFKRHNWNAPQGWWDLLGKEGKNLDLEWGGDWEFKDLPHFQLRPNKLTWKEMIKDFGRNY